MRIVVIGLGQMGGNMALTLHKAGFEVTGTDVFAAARQRLADRGLVVTEPDQLPAADVYLLSLPTSSQVEEVILKRPGLLQLAAKGSVIMDASTSDPESSKALAQQVEAAGLLWLDAPVSGGPAGAANASLGMLLGGAKSTVARLEPMLKAMTAKYTHVGGPGAGHVVKLANNYLCAAHLLSTAQAVALAQQAGVSQADCLAGLNSGSGRSAVSEVNFPNWILSDSFDSGFTMGLMRKDLGLFAAAARQLGLQGGLIGSVLQVWQQESASIPDQADFNRVTDIYLDK